MPLTYRQTKDIYDTLKDAGATTLSLPDWSRQMAATTESDTFDAGLKDNWLKRLNTSIDRGIEWTGLPELTGEFGAGIGSAFGMEEAGRSAGESIPRMAADMATFFIPGLGGATAAARILPAMGMAGMGAYTDTGSPAAGVASAALMGVLPGATNWAEQQALKYLGAKKMAGDIVSRASTNLMDSGVTEGFSRYMPQNLAQGAGAYTTGQAAAMGLMGGSTMAQQAFAGESISNPFTGEFWLSQGIQNLPFMALHGGRKLAGPSYKKAIESTGEALLAGHDALAWKQLQRDNWTYYPKKGEGKPKGPVQPLTPKAQEMWDKLQGKPPTEEDYTAANGWLTELEEARRRVEQEPTDEEARKNLRIVNSNLTAAIELGDIPFTAFVPRGVSLQEVEGRVSHVTPGGKVFADIVKADGTTERIGFPSTLLPDKYVVGQEGKFKIPGDPKYVERNVQQNPSYLAHIEALRAKEEARVAQEALQGTLPLTAEHDALRLRAEEAVRVSEGATAEEARLATIEKQQKLQEAADLVAQFTSLPMTTADEKQSKLGVAKQIEGLLTGAGLPSMFDRKAKRWGPLAGVTAHNLGLALDSKGALWLKSMLDELKASDADVREGPRKNKNVSLDAAAEQGDSLMAEVVGSQREFDEQLNTSEAQHEISTVLEASGTNDPIVASLHGDMLVKTLRETVGELQDVFDSWNKDEGINFREELIRMHAYADAKLAAGDRFDAKEFWDTQNVDLAESGGDLSTFEQRPHVLTLMKRFTEQLNRPGTPLAAKAKRNTFSAGGDFIWSVNPDVATPKQAPGGKVDESWFVKNAGIGQDKSVPGVEMEILKAVDKTMGLGIFEGGKVDMEKLKAAMSDPKVWPKVTEVTEFGPEGKLEVERGALADMTHNWYDTLADNQRTAVDDYMISAGWAEKERSAKRAEAIGVDRETLQQFTELSRTVQEGSRDKPRAQWMSMSSAEHGVGNPKGYFELAVAVPQKEMAGKEELSKKLGHTFKESPLFSGQHQPFPVNTLIHLRGYFGDHPTDGRVMVLEEVQSDWGQQRRKEEVRSAKVTAELKAKEQWFTDNGYKLEDYGGVPIVRTLAGKLVPTEGEVKTRLQDYQKLAFGDSPTISVASHPLLPVAHVLGLKAALAKIAKESPGTKLMVISEVGAMMVEGHDKAATWTVAKRFETEAEAKQFAGDKGQIVKGNNDAYPWEVKMPNVSQFNGMALAYGDKLFVIRDAEGKTLKGKVFTSEKEAQDALQPGQTVASQTGTLVGAMRKLTGDGGQEVVMPGVHKMAVERDTRGAVERQDWVATNNTTGELVHGATEQAVRERIATRRNPADWTVEVNPTPENVGKPVGSPVFQETHPETFPTRASAEAKGKELGGPLPWNVIEEKDGTFSLSRPETRVRGVVFDTEKSTANYEANSGFTLGGRSAAKKKKWVATEESIRRIAHREFNGGGRKLAEVISAMEDADPADRAMAELLIRNLPETLSRVESEFDAKGETEYAPMIRQRKGKITFAPWNVGESDNSWAGTAMEELQHHVGTIALRDPKNKEAFNGFENLRKRVVKGLSKEEKNAFDYLEKLFKKNPNRYIKQGEVHKDSKIEDLVYALQSVDEFYANGNRAHALRERLVSMEPTKHWLSEFVDNLKKLFGIGPKETAFDEFLFHTKQIMDSSEAVAKSFNYLEAHFAQRGYDPNRANDATQVAMRLMNKHGVGKGDPQTLFAELAKPSDMDSDQLLEAKGKFKELMASPDDVEMGNTALLFNDPNTGKALENWFMEQLDTPSSVSYFNAMPETVQRYLSLRVQQMQDVLLGIHNLSKNGSSPVTDLLSPKTLERTAKDMLERVQPFVRQQDVVRTAVSQVRAVESFGTENMLEVMGRPLAAKRKGETPDGFIDEKMGFLRKFTLQIGQWAQSNPLVKEVLVRAMSSRNLAQKFAESVQHDVMGYDPANPGVYNEKIAEGWRKWLEDGRNKDAVDKITSTNQVVGKDKVKLLAPDHPAMVAATKGIAPEVLAKAHQFVKQKSIGTQKGQAHILHRMGENGTVQGAKLVLLQETDVNVETAMTASRNVLDALVAIKENPADVMAGRKLEAAQKVLQPKTMEALMETHDRMSKVLIAAKLHFKNNDGWVSVQRRGEFLYKGFRGTEEINMGADSDKEVLARARKHGVKIDLKTKKPNDSGDYAEMNWSQDFIDRAKAYDDHVYEAARAAGASDEVLSTIQKLASGAQILKDQHVSHDVGAGETKGRTLSKGGDIVPFTDHFFAWLKGSPAYWNKRLIKEQVEMMLLAPEYRAAPETAKGLRQWLNGFLTPDPKGMQALQRAVTTFTLGGNVGFLMNNVFQPFLRGIPEIMSHEVGFWAAFRGVTGALKDAVKSFTKVGGMTDLSKGLPDANERWFMERLNNDLITDPQLFDESEMRKGYDSYKLTASLNASKPKTFGQWVASVGGAYSNVALSMVRHGERANTEATSLGAFRALMRTFPEKGREWAEQKARDVHQATNDPGGRFNRAIGLYDNAGPASRSAAMMAGALQSYTFGTIHQMIRNFQKGWKNSSLTPAEKYAGRKAFLTQLGLQFAVAGALGMPFVSGALALINQVDPSLEINKNVRGLMQQFFAEDGKDGHPLTDMMMSGLPSQLGWDMQSRMSSGELIPGVSERDGFQVSNLFGVPASLATQMAGGVKQIMSGQGAGLMAFVPPGLRSQIRLATGTAGQDNKGRQILNDMTPGEGVGLALGMRPTRLREFNDAQRMEKQAEEQDAIRKGRWRQKAAAQVLKGEFGTVMGELKSQLSLNPRLDVAGEVRQIAKYAEDQAFPRDLRREAKGDNRSALLAQWNLAPSMPTEEQRLQFRMKVEQQFGVRGDSGRALRDARMMDELQKQRPNATRSELRRMLPRATRPQPMLAE